MCRIHDERVHTAYTYTQKTLLFDAIRQSQDGVRGTRRCYEFSVRSSLFFFVRLVVLTSIGCTLLVTNFTTFLLCAYYLYSCVFGVS